MKLFGLKLFATTVACCAALTSQAATIWDESSSGDFSGIYTSPTALSLGLGSNVILGSTGNPGTGTDRDYFSFVVPDGTTLTSITLLDNTTVSGGASFIGFQVGPQFTVSPTQAQPGDLLGFTHYDPSFIGSDILPLLDGPFNGLPSGVYTAWVQDTGGGIATYGFDFNVTAVPLPGAAVLLFSGLLGLTPLRRRRALS